MKKSSVALMAIIVSISMSMLAGCQQQMPEERENVQQSESSFEDNISPIRAVTEGLKVESWNLWGRSTEGGSIARYTDENGIVVRYNVKLYGEIGHSESDYFFVDENIYYMELKEEYSSPIYAKNSNVIYRFLEKGVIKEGIYYQYNDANNEFLPAANIEIPYQSLNELNAEFDAAKQAGCQDYSKYNIVSINGFILGGNYDNKWIEAMALYPDIEAAEVYKIYIDGQYETDLQGQKYLLNEEDGDEPYLNFTETFGIGNLILAYSGEYDLKIENGIRIIPEHEIYQKSLQDYLEKNGLSGAFKLIDIVKVDIDDDGQDEIFIQAYQQAELNHESIGINYMRKVVDGEIKDFVLPLTTLPDSDYLTILGFCDLNDDGMKEVLISSSGTGYFGYLIYEFEDNKFIRVLENGHVH